MGQARHPLSLVLAVSAICVIVALPAGCGSSDESDTGNGAETERTTSTKAPAGATAQSCGDAGEGVADLRVTGVGCSSGRNVAAGWSKKPECYATGASRVSCTVADYRCLGARADRGLVVSCAGPGRSISFVATTR